MARATRQHISSGVSTTSPSLRARYRSRRTRSAGSVHVPTFDGRVSDSIGPPPLSVAPTVDNGDLALTVLRLRCASTGSGRGCQAPRPQCTPDPPNILWCAGRYHAESSVRQEKTVFDGFTSRGARLDAVDGGAVGGWTRYRSASRSRRATVPG